MIKENQWYYFNNPDDRDVFIALALKEFTFPTHVVSENVKSAQALRVNTESKEFPYFNYRSIYYPEYIINAIKFDPAAALGKNAGNKEAGMHDAVTKIVLNSVYGKVGDKGESYISMSDKKPVDPMLEIFDRYVYETRRENLAIYRKAYEEELLDSKVGEALKKFIDTAKIYDKEFCLDPTTLITPNMLSVVERGNLEKLDKVYKSDCDTFEKKMFITRNLLMAAPTYEQKYAILKREGMLK